MSCPVERLKSFNSGTSIDFDNIVGINSVYSTINFAVAWIQSTAQSIDVKTI